PESRLSASSTSLRVLDASIEVSAHAPSVVLAKACSTGTASMVADCANAGALHAAATMTATRQIFRLLNGTLAGRIRAPSFYWTVFRWDVSEPNRTSSKLVKR